MIYSEVRYSRTHPRIQDPDSHFVRRNIRRTANPLITDCLPLGDLPPLAVYSRVYSKLGDALAEVADLLLEHYKIESLFLVQSNYQLSLYGPIRRHPACGCITIERIGWFKTVSSTNRSSYSRTFGQVGLEDLAEDFADLLEHLAVAFGKQPIAIRRDIQQKDRVASYGAIPDIEYLLGRLDVLLFVAPEPAVPDRGIGFGRIPM